jgi:hypothetical protein
MPTRADTRTPFSADFRLIEGEGIPWIFLWISCVAILSHRTVRIFVLRDILRETFSLETEKAAGKAQPWLLPDLYFRRQRPPRSTGDRSAQSRICACGKVRRRSG